MVRGLALFTLAFGARSVWRRDCEHPVSKVIHTAQSLIHAVTTGCSHLPFCNTDPKLQSWVHHTLLPWPWLLGKALVLLHNSNHSGPGHIFRRHYLTCHSGSVLHPLLSPSGVLPLPPPPPPPVWGLQMGNITPGCAHSPRWRMPPLDGVPPHNFEADAASPVSACHLPSTARTAPVGLGLLIELVHREPFAQDIPQILQEATGPLGILCLSCLEGLSIAIWWDFKPVKDGCLYRIIIVGLLSRQCPICRLGFINH